jgi:putative phosphonate transport system ATP-binding protein
MDKIAFSVKHLSKQYGPGCAYCLDPKTQLEDNYCPQCKTVYAVRDVSFDVYEEEIIGIVGESGSGKSTVVKCLYFDEEVSSGTAITPYYENAKLDLLSLSNQQKRFVRNTVFGMVYQNPFLGLRMNFSAISNIGEKLISANYRNVRQMVNIGEGLLDTVNIPLRRIKEKPKNFSGGMQQRVQIAKALSNNPPLLLLDEITTGLDLSVQASVLDLVKRIKQEHKISMILISHDLSVIRMLADRTLVMHQGRVVEQGLTDQILEDPQHPYTQTLVSALL